MTREKMPYTEHFQVVTDILTTQGLLLGSYDSSGKANAMTIGWGSIGSIWSMPIWVVLVRPSRYTYQCIEQSGCFTVNVPTREMSAVCEVCGTKSGRDVDKFAACDLTAEKAPSVAAPIIGECPIAYECQVVHSNDVIPEMLAEEIRAGAYAAGDYHRVYFGKILGSYAAENAPELLA